MAAAVLPTMFAALSLAVPPRARSTGFAVAMAYLLPGLIIVRRGPGLGGRHLHRPLGCARLRARARPRRLVASPVHRVLDRDISNVWTTTAARAELLAARRRGSVKQLLVRDLDVRYGDVQVLFGVDFEIDEGEIVALLGTNGAGKSTLLRAITGVVTAANGAVVFEGRDITSSPPHEVAGTASPCSPAARACSRP